MPGRAAQLWTLAIVVLAVAAPAHAQERTPTPSAQELWREYPLRAAQPAPERSATPAAASSAAVTDPAGSDPLLVALVAAVAFVAAGTGTALLVRRRRSHGFAVPVAPAPRLALAGPPAAGHQLLFSRATRHEPQRLARSEPSGVRPPDPDRRWTAEVQWSRSGDTARFCVVARDEQGASEPVLARSEPFDWPPEGTAAVQALVAAADALAEGLTLAGWKALPRGEGWYAKRFEWAPAPVTEWAPPRPGPSAEPVERARAPAAAPRPPTKRFRPAGEWPPGTEALWRCAITWRPGYARSRFEVVMHDPAGEADDRVIAASPPFKWLFMSDPDPNDATVREAALDLAAALEAAGWDRVGVGALWYAARFVWRGDEPPPDEVLVAPARKAS